jgi:hypothetical protein
VVFATGAAPATGAVTPRIAAVLMRTAVAGNVALTVFESAKFVTGVAPLTVK